MALMEKNDKSTRRKKNRNVICVICKSENRSHPDRKFFSFPKESSRFSSWILACREHMCPKHVRAVEAKSPNSLYNSHYKVCSLHFQDHDYASTKRHFLHKSAIPTIFKNPGIDTVCEVRVAGAAGKDLKTIEIPTEEIYRVVQSLQNGILKKIKLEPGESFSESHPKTLSSGNETTSSEINSSSEPLTIPLDISTPVQSDLCPPSPTDCEEVPSASCLESLDESVLNEEDAGSDSESNEISSDEVELSSAAPVEKSSSEETALNKISSAISLKEKVLRAVLHTEKLKQEAEQIRIEYEQCRLEREKLELWKLKKECRQLGYDIEERHIDL